MSPIPWIRRLPAAVALAAFVAQQAADPAFFSAKPLYDFRRSPATPGTLPTPPP